MGVYSHRFRMKMIHRLTGPERISAVALAAEVGVPQPTLSRWLRAAATVSSMAKSTNDEAAQPVKRPQDWTPEERLRVVIEASGLGDERLGALLRREGLHEAVVTEWRRAALGALGDAPKRPRKRDPQSSVIRKLEAELRRKDKALAETAALLVLQGKAEALWGGGGDGTAKRSGKKPSS